MDIFYAAVEDDPLDSGGRVIDGGSCGTVQGEDGRHRKFVFLGQRAWCDKCEGAGVIVAAPGSPGKKRLYDQQRDRQQALGGDLVLCKCERHPRIIPVHGRKWKITGDTNCLGGTAGGPGVARAVEMAVDYDDRFVLRDAHGHALTDAAYALRRESGVFEYGETDEKGRTHLLSSAAAAENIYVFLAG
ncbi:PAAR domain-containing protein [Trinickia terrae]|uniref:PAAR domain-containing protein n=1 Tax=Trinickia terrae TaxID=2571161 RepID=A0A4V5PGL2_9BURK|nr:PAAR domain-containing protein [Trinickia terrae]TKC79910.1 PAAR domain-containing protein [Trinickia terrae]